MRMVIEIPDALKTKVDNTSDKEAISWVDWFDGTLVYAIRNGTVLPEQYGDLIDRNVFASDEYLERRYGADFYWEFRRRLDKQNAIIKSNRIKK